MTAAELTPTSVQKFYIPSTNVYGSAGLRLVKYFVKVTKAAQSDWIVPATYLLGSAAGSIVDVAGYTIDSSSNGVIETLTYANTGDKLVIGGSTTGTTYLEVTVKL